MAISIHYHKFANKKMICLILKLKSHCLFKKKIKIILQKKYFNDASIKNWKNLFLYFNFLAFIILECWNSIRI